MGGRTRPPYPPAYRAEAVRAMREAGRLGARTLGHDQAGRLDLTANADPRNVS